MIIFILTVLIGLYIVKGGWRDYKRLRDYFEQELNLPREVLLIIITIIMALLLIFLPR